MRAKILVALACRDLLHGRHVKMWGDSKVVMHVATKLTSRSPVLMAETRQLFDTLDALNATATEYWLATHLNVDADRLSREEDSGDWRQDPRVFADLDRRWGPHSVDRFATSINAQLPR
jgi:hypothetical protein